MGMAFHPDFANNGRFFVSYACDVRKNKDCRVRARDSHMGRSPSLMVQLLPCFIASGRCLSVLKASFTGCGQQLCCLLTRVPTAPKCPVSLRSAARLPQKMSPLRHGHNRCRVHRAAALQLCSERLCATCHPGKLQPRPTAGGDLSECGGEAEGVGFWTAVPQPHLRGDFLR